MEIAAATRRHVTKCSASSYSKSLNASASEWSWLFNGAMYNSRIKAVRLLDAILETRLAKDPELLAAWRSAKRVPPQAVSATQAIAPAVPVAPVAPAARSAATVVHDGKSNVVAAVRCSTRCR
jgi:hypothetical protein